MKLWLDAQLSPAMAPWIVKQFAIEAVSVRDVGLRDASDVHIFEAAKQAEVVLATKGMWWPINLQGDAHNRR